MHMNTNTNQWNIVTAIWIELENGYVTLRNNFCTQPETSVKKGENIREMPLRIHQNDYYVFDIC